MGERAKVAMAKIGANLKAIRKGKSMTQKGVAGMAGVNRSLLSQVENGKANIGLAKLCALAEALGVTMKEIVARGEIPGAEGETRTIDLAEGRPGRDVWLKVRHPLD